MGLYRQNIKINVIYKDGTKDQVSPALLNTLIDAKQIEQFERSSGWVKVDSDQIRHVGATDFPGKERRKD
ncbi:MAG: hypothetical protein KAG93_04965 [Desulfuromusa sp.]|nr:hypothetical protein [Desulfuromusa sp.]